MIFKVAILQMRSENRAYEENSKTIIKNMTEAKENNADILLLPECQGKGVGRKIIETLERDEYFIRAKRVEVPASITGAGFYRKLGYEYKNGIDHPDEERLYRLEKFRNIKQG